MPEFIFRSTPGKIHRSLRTRGTQSIGELARWLRIPSTAVFKAVCGDDRIGWCGWPEADLDNVLVRLVTKEAAR